ncbi:MAG: hypothetical protein HY903_25015 [Deltaproteobacteria bacterium]|nr:hypothetical protein [Deltaproteobacteria bacterium]
MTRVLEIRALEDCFDGSFAKEIRVDPPVDEATMRRLATEAQLSYYPEFPRPYFRIEKWGFYVIQGVVGNATFRVTFARSAVNAALAHLQDLTEQGEDHG